MKSSFYSAQSDGKLLGTVETLGVILEHRKILSECIKEMDASAVNYITEYAIFDRVNTYTKPVKSDTRKRVQIALSTVNLLQANIVMDVDNGQGENRLYFQKSVLDVVRLCDVSLFKKLTDVQLKTHLQLLNHAHQQMTSGIYDFDMLNADFSEFIDELLMNTGRLLSDIRQNVVKMQSISKELEELTSNSTKGSMNTADYIAAKQQWLSEIVKLYERHILPVLLFLNPDTTYEGFDGLHAILSKIRDTLNAHQQDSIANNIQGYGLSLLNFYQPIEATANAVNRFIHKERDSIKRFNAIEYFYQQKLLPELKSTQSDNLNKKLMGNAAIIKPAFSPNIKAFTRPIGYGFNDSPAYFKNLFNELEARAQDAFQLSDLSTVFGKSTADTSALHKMQRHQQLLGVLSKVTLRETDDVLKMLHMRLVDEFDAYRLYDLIYCVSYFTSKHPAFRLKTTNLFAVAEHQSASYKYRKVRCLPSAASDRHSLASKPPSVEEKSNAPF